MEENRNFCRIIEVLAEDLQGSGGIVSAKKGAMQSGGQNGAKAAGS
jgi:hypothetical protein